MQDLLAQGVVLEMFGGTTLSTAISAKKGTNVPELLEQILLQAELLDLKANPNRDGGGRGHRGAARSGQGSGRDASSCRTARSRSARTSSAACSPDASARCSTNAAKPVKEAGPAIPVQVLGLAGVPMAGDQFLVVDDATQARDIAQRRERLDREAKSSPHRQGLRHARGLRVAGGRGSDADAAASSSRPTRAVRPKRSPTRSSQLSNAEVQIEVIHRGVGAITESDILLARTAGAIIIGFHVRPDNNARSAAEREGVDIKLYKVIYEAVDDIRSRLEGLLRPEEREVILGEAEVREIFKVSRVGTIAGCSVRSGMITRTATRPRHSRSASRSTRAPSRRCAASRTT